MYSMYVIVVYTLKLTQTRLHRIFWNLHQTRILGQNLYTKVILKINPHFDHTIFP